MQRRAARTLGALLIEQELADLLALLGRERACLLRSEHCERGVRAVVHGALADVEHCGDARVAVAAAQQQRKRRLLVGRQVVESAHHHCGGLVCEWSVTPRAAGGEPET